jgi:1-deoxy-D-xylulose-5-phosphate reductoisomerase
LDVISRHPDRFEVFALTGAKQVDLMLNQCAHFKPTFAVMVDPLSATALKSLLEREQLSTQVLSGAEALIQVADDERVDTVMAAIVGAAGLPSCMAAALAGKRLLLANKEALVVGADLFMQAVSKGGAQLLPIDSEHSAIFQALPENPSTWGKVVHKIILTASGGPFRQWDPAHMRDVTPEQACAHPNWVMGRKISVDSATMMNKALEVIEAKFLFGARPEQIEALIHPQSIVHSMVEFVDGSIVAQLGTPDMRMPISYGLAWPDRIVSGADHINFQLASQMTFETWQGSDHERRFPGLKLAWQALSAPLGTTAILNAANEVAVDLFLQRQIRFDQIHALNVETLASIDPGKPHSLEELLEMDAKTRRIAFEKAKNMMRPPS